MQVRVSEEVPEGIALTPYHHAIRLSLMIVAAEAGTGRRLLDPTPVLVGPAE